VNHAGRRPLDIVVDLNTGRNFDYQLSSGTGRVIALEIFRLVDSEEVIAQREAALSTPTRAPQTLLYTSLNRLI